MHQKQVYRSHLQNKRCRSGNRRILQSVIPLQKWLRPGEKQKMTVKSSCWVSDFTKRLPPPSCTPSSPIAGTTAKGEIASYQAMGDLLIRRRPPRILVVDDQPSIAGLMSQLLTMRGYDVITASDAEQADNPNVSRHVLIGDSGYCAVSPPGIRGLGRSLSSERSNRSRIYARSLPHVGRFIRTRRRKRVAPVRGEGPERGHLGPIRAAPTLDPVTGKTPSLNR